jgi:hypothetical protein
MSPRLSGILVGIALVASLPAVADVIDGEWCGPGGRHVSINGPLLVAPGGSRIDGSYTRHSFEYVAPSAEPDSGQTVFMRLINEETVHVRRAADSAAAGQAPVEIWKRCAPGISEAVPLGTRPAGRG